MNIRLDTVFRTEYAGFATLSLTKAECAQVGATDVEAFADGVPIPCSFARTEDADELIVMFPLVQAKEYRFRLMLADAGANASEALLSASKLAWGSRVNWRLKGRQCRKALGIAEAVACGESVIEPLQLLEFSKTADIVRFAVTDDVAIPEANYSVYAANGAPKPAIAIELERTVAHGKRKRVLSAVVPKGGFPFAITDGQRQIVPLTREKAFDLLRERDIAMINPAIDERYPELAGLLAKRDAPIIPEGGFAESPTISIVCPLYNTPVRFLTDMIDSVCAQSYANWELVLANSTPDNADMRSVLDGYDDARIREIKLERNFGIVGNTNAGIAATTGEWIAFLDHDDMIAPHALARYVAWINEHPEDELLYCDEDGFTEADKPHFAPLLKPDFNIDLLYTHNYIIHFLMAKRSLVESIERADADVEGVQDYDLILKAIERNARIGHVPHILYWWRQHENSTAGGVVAAKPESEAAGAHAIEAHLARRGLSAKVEVTDIPFVYRTCYRADDALANTAAIVVCANAERSTRLLEALQPLRKDGGLRVIAACNRALAEEIGALSLADEVATADDSLGYGPRINTACKSADGRTMAVVLADVLKPDAAGCIETLVSYLKRDEVGVAAAKLLYADETVQHAGICVKRDGSLGFLNQNFALHMGGGYHGMAECDCDYSAVGPDFCAFRIDLFEEVGCFSDYGANALATVVDFSFKVRATGRFALVSPEACAHVQAPIIWAARRGPWSAEDAAVKKLWETWQGSRFAVDALANPLVDLESSYPRLNAGALAQATRNNGAEAPTDCEGNPMPKVSVILPIYNAQPYLRQCLDSIRDQTLADIEVLCVNDGSTDDSLDVIREYAAADERFICLDKPNGGYGHSLNYGIARAKGEFIAVVEPDDFIHPAMYEQLCMFANFGGAPADIVKGSYWEFYDGRDGFSDQIIRPPLTDLMSDVPFAFRLDDDRTVIQLHPSIWSAIYRRSFLESNHIRFIEPKGAGWADNPFLIDTMVAAERIVWVPKAFYYYRQTNPGASSFLKDFRMPFERLHDMFEIADARGASDAVKSSLYLRAFRYIASITGEFGFDEVDPDLQQLIDDILLEMDPDIVYTSTDILLEHVTFYESRLKLRSNTQPSEPLAPPADTPTPDDGETPAVTYLIPLTNNAQHAAQSLASLTALPIDSFEALFVECGATDRTHDLCARFSAGDARFRFVESAGLGPGDALNRALDLAHGSYVFIVDLGTRFTGTSFAHALLLACEQDVDVVLCDSASRFPTEALCASGTAQPHEEWEAGGQHALLTRPFASKRASDFALNCGDALSHAGLYRTALLQAKHVRFADDDIACDRLFLAHALAVAHTVAYMAAPFQERFYEERIWVPFYLDIHVRRVNEKPLALPGALAAARDDVARKLFPTSALNLVVDAFAEDVASREEVQSLTEYVDANLDLVTEALEAAPDGIWVHDGEAHGHYELLREEGLEGYCRYCYLIQRRDSEIRLKLLEDMAASRTYKLGKLTSGLLKAVIPTRIIAKLRSTKADERG